MNKMEMNNEMNGLDFGTGNEQLNIGISDEWDKSD